MVLYSALLALKVYCILREIYRLKVLSKTCRKVCSVGTTGVCRSGLQSLLFRAFCGALVRKRGTVSSICEQ